MGKKETIIPSYGKMYKELYNWLFHYNPYTKLWNAFPRDEEAKYFNGESENMVSYPTHKGCVCKAYVKETSK